MARSGTTWRRLPPASGKGNSVRRLAHGCARGVWARLMAYLQAQPKPEPELSAGLRDSTVGRAHACAAGAPQQKGLDPALGRGRGGLSTQIHILADPRGRPLCLRLTGGQRHDSTQARAWVEAWTGAPLPCLITDRAYDGDAFRAWRERQGIEAVIPARKRRTNPRPHAPARYQARNAVERGLAQARATRGYPLRQIRPSFPGLSVSGRGLDLDAAKAPHNLTQ